MPRRYVAALIKRETNTFSPLATPLSAFGHGEGPAAGAVVRAGCDAAMLEVRRGGARAEIVVTERPHEPFDLGVFTHAGIDRRRRRDLMLKSRIHYRAGFLGIAARVVECAGEGVTNADLSVYPYRRLRRPIHPLDSM